MVCKITHPKSIHRAIYYSELKVDKKDAKCIYAANFLKEASHLTLPEKKQRFDQLISLNNRVERNTLHVSLNFAPGERIPMEKMIEIAQDYMERLGFGDQPYLVYQHTDAAHPHVHIVSTNIAPGGKRIDMNFIGRDKSEPARKAIEEKYALIRAEDQRRFKQRIISPLPTQTLRYGKSETKRSITNVLEKVLPTHKYRSLAELNAILGLYGIRADPGKPGSRIQKHKGLVYQMIDEQGAGVGVRIKASSIHFKPGIKYLWGQFKRSGPPEPAELNKFRSLIDQCIRSTPMRWREFVLALKGQHIEIIPYFNEQGFCYGMTFVDLDGKEAIKASDLGKGFSAKTLLARFRLDPFMNQLPPKKARKHRPATTPNATHQQTKSSDLDKIINILFRPETDNTQLPRELSQRAKKKKPKPRHI